MSSPEDISKSLVPAARADPPDMVDAADSASSDLPSLQHAKIATARRFADASRAASTQRAYASDWRRFSAWCLACGIETLPADPLAVAVFLSAEAQAREGAAAILEVMVGIRRIHGIPTSSACPRGCASLSGAARPTRMVPAPPSPFSEA